MNPDWQGYLTYKAEVPWLTFLLPGGSGYLNFDRFVLLLMCVAFVPLLTLCLIRCVKNRKSDPGKTLGRIWLTLSPTILTTRDPAGIIQPNVNVMFYSRPPTRQDPPSAILARALSPTNLKDRLTTPLMPLNPAYKPSQQVKVTTSSPAATSTGALHSENELTLPPGYIVNREAKYM